MGERHYTIAEIAKKVGVEPHLLRYWEDELALDIPRNERGIRYYRRQELMLFRAIQNLRTKGFRMSAIKMVLEDIYRVEDLPAEKLLELRDRIDDAMGLKRLDATFEDGTERVPLRSIPTKAQTRDMDGEGSANSLDATVELPTEAVTTGGNTILSQSPVTSGTDATLSVSDAEKSAMKLAQFRKLMTEIVYDAVRHNNDELSRKINYTVSDSVVREMDHLLRKRDERQEVHFRKLDQALSGFRREMSEQGAARYGLSEKAELRRELGEVAATTEPDRNATEKKHTFGFFHKKAE